MSVTELAEALHKKYFNKKDNVYENGILTFGLTESNLIVYFLSQKGMDSFKEEDPRIICKYTGPVEINI